MFIKSVKEEGDGLRAAQQMMVVIVTPQTSTDQINTKHILAGIAHDGRSNPIYHQNSLRVMCEMKRAFTGGFLGLTVSADNHSSTQNAVLFAMKNSGCVLNDPRNDYALSMPTLPNRVMWEMAIWISDIRHNLKAVFKQVNGKGLCT